MTKEELERLRSEWNKLHVGIGHPSSLRFLVRKSPWWRFWNVEYEDVGR